MKTTNKFACFVIFSSLTCISSSIFGQVSNSAASKLITVQALQTIDSTKSASGAQFSGKLVSAVTTPQGTTLAAGTAAVMALQQNGATWSLALISPVTGTEMSIGGAASAATGIANQLGSQFGGLSLGGFGKKKNTQSTTNSTTSSLSGARVYVAANSQVRFTMTQTAAAPAAVSGTPAAAQPAALVNPAAPAAGQPAAATATPAAVSNPAANPATQTAGQTTVTFGGVQYVLQGCQRQAPHITCSIQMTNLNAADANFLTNRQTYFIDQSGNRIGLNNATLANCNLLGGCLALSGLPMAGSFVFVDEDSKSTQLVRLQIQTRAGPVQFTNVPVK